MGGASFLMILLTTSTDIKQHITTHLRESVWMSLFQDGMV
jgi:hypothetical protein